MRCTTIALVIVTVILFTGCFDSQPNSRIDLKGEWNVRLDSNNEYVTNSISSKTEGKIKLPGSLAENGYGKKSNGSDYGILTPEYKYIGKAWYEKTITVPEEWADKELELFLERVLWKSVIFVDGNEVSSRDAIGTPHVHYIGKLSPGKHILSVMVDNTMIHNIGDKGHAYSDYTQSIWNGIVGRIELSAHDQLRILSVRTFPDLSKDEIKFEVTLNTEPVDDVTINYSIKNIPSGRRIIKNHVLVSEFYGQNKFYVTVPLNGKLEKWSENSPVVYNLDLTLTSGKLVSHYENEFGYYEVSHDGTKVLINGMPVFLRGNLDCIHFPLKGYPSCDLKDWMDIFQKYKDYGLNHVRFHSWCPPEAAFRAANRMGIYIQAEASIWIDWWMSTDMVAQGRPEMDTKGHPAGLGKDAVRDSFVVSEMNRVVDFYGNHPSFTMFCIGNELGNADFVELNKWIGALKVKDPRRLYAASTARQINETDDYSVTHHIPEVGRTRGLNGARTDWDFEDTYGKMNIPIIAHEIGQWPVYPKWAEIEKYTGVLKARNLEDLKMLAEANGVRDQDVDFSLASGALNQIMYKYEIESFLRTPSCAGIQLLSMQDYQGQGEALIGWLDSHWGEKGITSPEKFRKHHNSTVPILRFEKFVWLNNEVFNASAQLAHHGHTKLNNECEWSITNSSGHTLGSGLFPKREFQVGTLSDIGNISFPLNGINKAEKLTITIKVDGTDFLNQWNIWVYPDYENNTSNAESVLVTADWNQEVLEKLQSGLNVLLISNNLGTSETSVNAHFYPLYWSLTFFPGQGKTCIGLLVQNNHPAFNEFPTSYHSDWQWETISSDARGFIINDLPSEYRPLAQPVDDFHRSNKVGSIFELKVGKGKLLVCGYNLNSGLPVSNQLKQSLLGYMKSNAFNPKQEVNSDWILELLPIVPRADQTILSTEFEGAILDVDAGKELNDQNKSVKWDKKWDRLNVANGTDYHVVSDGIWKDNKGTAWHGRQMEIEIDCPEGFLGTLYAHFHDWNNIGRSGTLEFEGRKTKLDKHDKDGVWVKFHVMREDSNDGTLRLKTAVDSGPNLMITKLILVKE